MKLYEFIPKFVGNTLPERIQNAPLYHLDWAKFGLLDTPTVNINSWRGIIDIENFSTGTIPPPTTGSYVVFNLTGPQVAVERDQIYMQLTPYYQHGDGSLPYVIPVGGGPINTPTSQIAIYNLGTTDDFGGAFYIYFELGVNYAKPRTSQPPAF